MRFRTIFMISLAAVVFAVFVIPVLSQSAATQQPSFEVASIKQIKLGPGLIKGPIEQTLGCHGTDSHSPGIMLPMGRCVSRFEPLRMVIALAFDIPPALMYPYEGKVVIGPDWINQDMYDIEAKAEDPTTEAQLKLMLQALLTDRFKLKLHRENREMPVYALVAGKNGVKFPKAPADRECGEQRRSDHRYELGATDLSSQCHGFVPQGGALTGRSVDMSDFAEMLAIWAGRKVIDKTGAEGLFDIRMPQMIAESARLALEARGGAPGADGKGGVNALQIPTVFEAVEQFGLKLESTKGPVEVLVIDSIERPSEN
ncbi:MAG TPA: TIGR03435 family protein [Terriglobia bacterium]|jgi:uncharacterized protein (TIGR03435 family)